MERVMDQPVARHEGAPASAYPSSGEAPTVGEAARRNWLLIVFAVLVCGGLGAYAGSARDPVYTSSATLSIGRLDLSVQSIPGFAVGGEFVAGGMSRSVKASEVVDPVARRLGLDADEVRAHVASTPVPDSPLFTITATSESADSATALANAMGEAMVEFGNRGEQQGEGERLLRRYRAVTLDLATARSRERSLRNQLVRDTAEIRRQEAQVEALELRQEMAASVYRESRSQEQLGAVVEMLTPARGATSDRDSKLQLFAGLGALTGLLLGLALAVARTAWRSRRQRA
jgi:uncharacterized protein involved in exopolysaccharide biosynthesis